MQDIVLGLLCGAIKGLFREHIGIITAARRFGQQIVAQQIAGGIPGVSRKRSRRPRRYTLVSPLT